MPEDTEIRPKANDTSGGFMPPLVFAEMDRGKIEISSKIMIANCKNKSCVGWTRRSYPNNRP